MDCIENNRKKDGFNGQKAIVLPRKIVESCESSPLVHNLFITDIGFYPKAKYHYRKRQHGSAQHILIYCTDGAGWFEIDGHTVNVKQGSFLYIPAGEPHVYGSHENDPWSIYWMHFKGTNSMDFADMMLKRMGDHVASISFQEKRLHLFEEIYTSLERGYSIDNICYASVCLQHFLASCCFDNNYLAIHEKTDSISLCVNYLQKHIDKPLSLNDIASAVNLSVSHFASIFKKNTGFSIIEYFNHLKTQKACQYLQFTDLRINEIADRLGIEDPYYFSRMFTKIVGTSPNKYRSRRKVLVIADKLA